MRYIEFRAAIQQHLQRNGQGATWIELRERLALPYDRPCPEWTRQLEEEIGLVAKAPDVRWSGSFHRRPLPLPEPMFDHIGIFVSDSERSIAFYERCLAPLGITIAQRQPEWGAAIFSGASDFPFLWVGPARGEYHGTPLSPSVHRPLHLAFLAPSREAVNEFHARALAHGGKDNGAPEDCGNGYYAAYVLDPDGNNIEAGLRSGT